MADNNPFLSGPAPSQANVVESAYKYPTLQWLGSPNNNLTGWYISQQFVETVPELRFFEPPKGISIATATFGGKESEGWSPTNGVLTLHTIRSAFRWEVWNDKERRVKLYYSWPDAKAYADRVQSKAKSRFMALVMVREIGPYPFFMTSHGDITRELRSFIGWGSKPEYRSVVQNMALAATQYAKQNKRDIIYGQEVFALPIGPGKERRAGTGANTSKVVPPAIHGFDDKAEIDVTLAARYFRKDDVELWGEGGVFEQWLGDTEEGGVFHAWERKIATVDRDGAEGEAEESEGGDVPGMEPSGFTMGDFAPAPNAPHKSPLSKAQIQEQVAIARKTVIAGATNGGFDGKDADGDDFNVAYDAMRVAGYPASADLVKQMFIDLYGPQVGKPTQLQVRGLALFLKSPMHEELRAALWPQQS